MRLLFAITVLCFCAVLWVALALARRIRLGQMLTAKPKPKPIRLPAVREFFEAGEFRTPRPMHLDQEIFKQRPRRPLAEISLVSESLSSSAGRPASLYPAGNGLRNAAPVPIRASGTYATLFGQSVSVAQIDSHRQHASHSLPSSAAQNNSVTDAATSPSELSNRRIPPQPERASGLRRRIDLSHFNKDLGDLTDPYTNPIRGSGTQGLSTTDNRYGYKT